MKKFSLSTLFIWTCSIAFSQITLTSTVTNVSCYGLANGSATITATGGVSPYTYSWTPSGSTTPTSTSLPAGTYSAIVMDAMANTNTLTVIISQPQMLNIVMSQTNTTCYGTCDGAASCIVTGGTPAYTYAWSNGYVTSQSTGLCAGVYSLSVTDSQGCISNSTATITSGVSPNLTVNSGAFCSGSGSTTLSVTGANSYTWSPAIGLNSTSAPSVIASPMTTTIYTVTGSIGSCISSASTQVTVYPSPTISFSLTQNATPHVWDITPNYSGGTGPYTYIWSFGDGSPNSNLPYPSHTYTTAGWYNVCVTLTDNNGCASTTCQNDSLYRMSSSNSMITVNVINGTTTNINEINSDKSLSIFPNPSNGNVKIQTKKDVQSISVTVTDITGKIIYNDKTIVTNGFANLNIGVEAGTYFITVINILTNEKIIKKLIIQ